MPGPAEAPQPHPSSRASQSRARTPGGPPKTHEKKHRSRWRPRRARVDAHGQAPTPSGPSPQNLLLPLLHSVKEALQLAGPLAVHKPLSDASVQAPGELWGVHSRASPVCSASLSPSRCVYPESNVIPNQSPQTPLGSTFHHLRDKVPRRAREPPREGTPGASFIPPRLPSRARLTAQRFGVTVFTALPMRH